MGGGGGEGGRRREGERGGGERGAEAEKDCINKENSHTLTRNGSIT